MTTAALAAKDIKRHLGELFPLIRFRVTSKTYSGGNSVSIHWTNGPTYDYVMSHVRQFEYGYFDCMNDSYNYNNRREDLHQVKYVLATREMSPSAEENIRTILEKAYEVDLSDTTECWKKFGCTVSEMVYREFRQRTY